MGNPGSAEEYKNGSCPHLRSYAAKSDLYHNLGSSRPGDEAKTGHVPVIPHYFILRLINAGISNSSLAESSTISLGSLAGL